MPASKDLDLLSSPVMRVKESFRRFQELGERYDSPGTYGYIALNLTSRALESGDLIYTTYSNFTGQAKVVEIQYAESSPSSATIRLAEIQGQFHKDGQVYKDSTFVGVITSDGVFNKNLAWFLTLVEEFREASSHLLFSPTGIIFWIFYWEAETLETLGVHKARALTDQNKDFVVSPIYSSQSPDDPTFYKLELTVNDTTVEVPLSSLDSILVYDSGELKARVPSITASADYTVRDYASAFRAITDLISLTDPDLAKLLGAPGSADSLLLDVLAYLYDRLQFYVDLSNSSWDIESASGELLDILARNLGYEPVPPLPSKLRIYVSFRPEFTSQVAAYLLTKLPMTDSEKLTLVDAYNSPDLSVKLSAPAWAGLAEALPKKITLEGFSFYPESSSDELSRELSVSLTSSRAYRVVGSEVPRVYVQRVPVSEVVHIDLALSKSREVSLQYVPVDPSSIKLSSPENSFVEFVLITGASDLMAAFHDIALSYQSDPSKIKVPVFVSINRAGKATLTFLAPITGSFAPSSLAVEVSYATHDAERANAMFPEGSVFVPIDSQGLSSLTVSYGKSRKVITMSELLDSGFWSASPVAYWRIDPDYSTYGGYSGDTDQLVRAAIREYVSGVKASTLSPVKFLQRAVVEEDYELLLKSWNKQKILDVKVVPRARQIRLVIPEKEKQEVTTS